MEGAAATLTVEVARATKASMRTGRAKATRNMREAADAAAEAVADSGRTSAGAAAAAEEAAARAGKATREEEARAERTAAEGAGAEGVASAEAEVSAADSAAATAAVEDVEAAASEEVRGSCVHALLRICRNQCSKYRII